MDVYTALWVLWLATFVVIEGFALANKKRGDTLSEHVWKWFSIKGKSKGFKFRRVVLLVLMTWLTVHFVTGGFV